jgi:hypothetical protein
LCLPPLSTLVFKLDRHKKTLQAESAAQES